MVVGMTPAKILPDEKAAGRSSVKNNLPQPQLSKNFQTYTGQIFGGTLTAEPVPKTSRSNSPSPQDWKLTWKGPQGQFTTTVPLQGQFGPRQLENGSYAKKIIGQWIKTRPMQAAPQWASEALKVVQGLPVTLNALDPRLGLVAGPPSNLWDQGINGLADFLGRGVGRLSMLTPWKIPPSTPLQQQFSQHRGSVALHAITRAGIPIDAQGRIQLPNDAAGGQLLAYLLAQTGQAGDPNGRGLSNVVKGSLALNKGLAKEYGLSPEFIQGLKESEKKMAEGELLNVANTLANLGVMQARRTPQIKKLEASALVPVNQTPDRVQAAASLPLALAKLKEFTAQVKGAIENNNRTQLTHLRQNINHALGETTSLWKESGRIGTEEFQLTQVAAQQALVRIDGAIKSNVNQPPEKNPVLPPGVSTSSNPVNTQASNNIVPAKEIKKPTEKNPTINLDWLTIDGSQLNLKITSPENLVRAIQIHFGKENPRKAAFEVLVFSRFLKKQNLALYNHPTVQGALQAVLNSSSASKVPEIISVARIPVVLNSLNSSGGLPNRNPEIPIKPSGKLAPLPPKSLIPTISRQDLLLLWESWIARPNIEPSEAEMRSLVQALILLGPPEGRKWASHASIKSGPINQIEKNVVSALAKAINQIENHDLARLGAKTIEILRVDIIYRESLSEYAIGTKNRQNLMIREGYIPGYADPFQPAISKLTQASDLARKSVIVDLTGNPIDPRRPLKKNVGPGLVISGQKIPDDLYTQIGLASRKHIFAIPDIHGNYVFFRGAIIFSAKQVESLKFNIEDVIVVQLGDLLNKGYQPARVVELMKTIKEISNSISDSEFNQLIDKYKKDGDLYNALKTLRGARVVALRGNHEELANYALHMVKDTPNRDYSSKVHEMFRKGFDNTATSYLNDINPEFSLSGKEKEFMQEALKAYPVWSKNKNSWEWKGPEAIHKNQAPSDTDAQIFWNRYKAIWIDKILQKSGHLDFFKGLSAAYEVPYDGGNALFTHGGFPTTQENLQQLINHLENGAPLPDDVLSDILWLRGLTNPELIEKINKIRGNKYETSFHGHTMSGMPVRGKSNNSADFYQQNISLDAGFGTNSLAMLHIQPNGLAVIIVAKRTSRGLVYEAVSLSDSPGLGTKELPNRF